jgi:hypothetical protein
MGHNVLKLAGRGGVVTDPQFEYVTMLLHGDGTNGAQNNTFTDSSTNNFTITRNGNTTQGTFSPYGSNWSNYFDGSGDYLTFPNNTAFAFGTGAFTIEFWVNSNNLNDSFLLSGRAAIGTMHITTGGFGGSTAGALRYVGSSTITSGSTLISNNLWNHCAIVRDGSNNITLYVNGVSVGTGTDTTNYTTTSGTWYINCNDSGPTPGQAGYISNLRIVKGTAVYTSAFTPSTAPLTAITNTSLLTCQSNRFIDNSTNAFTITRNGDVSVQRFSPFAPTAAYSAATIGGSGYFDGSGDYLSGSNNSVSFGTSDFTIELWLYKNTTATQRIVGGVNSGSESFQLYIFNNNELSFFDGSGVLSASPTNLVTGAWNHIAVTRSSSTLRLYCNGTQATSASNTRNIVSDTVRVGAGGAAITETVNGYICDARILKGTAQYTGSTYTVPTAPLTAITNTSLLLNFTNAGIIDNAMMNDLETVGNAQISTSVKKYGTGSLAFDGNGDALVPPPNAMFNMGTGNFTIECWVYPQTQVQNFPGVFNLSGVADLSVAFDHSDGTNDSFSMLLGATRTSASVTSAVDNWYHIALVRNGTTVTLYIDGTSRATATNSSTLGGNNCTIGMYSTSFSSTSFKGYIDDLRITKGYARYTSNFTPPTAAFPNN